INDHNQRVRARRREFILHDGDELGGRTPVFVAAQYSQIRNLMKPIRNVIGSLLPEGELRNGQDNLIWPASLIQQRINRRPESFNPVRNCGKSNDESLV